MHDFSVSVYERTGSPYWYARCYLPGCGDKPERWSTGVRLDSEGGKRGSRRLATRRAEEQAAKLAAEARLSAAAESDTALSAVFRRMVRQKVADGRRDRAVESLAHSFEKHVEPFFGATRDVRTVRRPDLEAFKRSLVDKGLGATTVNNNLTVIRQVLKHAVNVEELLDTLPHVANVRVSNESKGRALTEKQVVALLEAVNPRELEAQQFLAFVVNTGMRKTETLSMRWGWVNWERATLNIPGEFRKGGRAKVVALNDDAMAVLVARRDHGTKYTGRRKDPLPTGPEDRVWIQKKHDASRNSAAERAGLGRVRTHDLRHTRGSLLYASGASLPEVRDELGHATMAMVNRYAHSYEEKRHDVARRVSISVCRVNVSGEGSNPAQNGPEPTQRRRRDGR